MHVVGKAFSVSGTVLKWEIGSDQWEEGNVRKSHGGADREPTWHVASDGLVMSNFEQKGSEAFLYTRLSWRQTARYCAYTGIQPS
jgi:hypothetical protein